jgi:AcrR family transcriptional regulator
MAIVSTELTQSRREEIIDACEKLYKTQSFKDITIKDIAQQTSFSRASVYNYFETKEEVFTALMQREYERWTEMLRSRTEGLKSLSAEQAAEILSDTLSDRVQLLKLLSMNHYDMEEHTRLELLTDFKKAFYGSIQAVRDLIGCIDGAAKPDPERFAYFFFPAMFGFYPYCKATDKQKEAMRAAGMSGRERDLKGMICDYALTLLKSV